MTCSTASASSPVVSEQAHRRFIRDILLTNLPLPIIKLRTYVWLSMLSRSLGTEGYGAWSMYFLTLGLLAVVGSMTLGNAMMRFLSGRRGTAETREVFSSVLTAISISSTFIALAIWSAAGYLSNAIFRRPDYGIIVILLGATVISDLFYEQIRGFLRARRQNRSWAIFVIARVVPEMIATVWSAWYFRRLLVVVCVYLATSILSVVGGLSYLVAAHEFRLVPPSWRILRRYCAYGLALVPGALAAMLSFSADKYLVAHYLDLSQVGIYSVCFTISALGFFLVGPINDVLMPEMSALYEEQDWKTFDLRFAGIQKFVFGFGLGATAILAACPSALLKLFAGTAFAPGGSALLILGFQGVFMSFVMLYAVILNVRLRVWTSSVVWAGMGAIILITDVILIPRIGIVGAAMSQLVSAMVGTVVVLWLNWSMFRRTFQISWALRACGAAAVVWLVATAPAVARGIDRNPIPAILLSASLYTIGLFVTRFTDMNDIKTLVGALLPGALRFRHSG